MSWIQTVKEITELVQKADNIDLMRKVLDLQGEMLEMQAQMTALRDENTQLKRTRALRDSIKFDESGWYFMTVNDRREGPFCPTCFDDCDKLIRPAIYASDDLAQCNICHRPGKVPR